MSYPQQKVSKRLTKLLQPLMQRYHLGSMMDLIHGDSDLGC